MAELTLERWTHCPNGVPASARTLELAIQDNDPRPASNHTKRTTTLARIVTRGDLSVLTAHGCTSRDILITDPTGDLAIRKILRAVRFDPSTPLDLDISALGVRLSFDNNFPFITFPGTGWRGQDAVPGKTPADGELLKDYLPAPIVGPSGTPAFTGSATTFTFAASSNSASRTIPSAAAVHMAFSWNGSDVSWTVTIAGAAPTLSYSHFYAIGAGTWHGIWIGAASGSQTVAISTSSSQNVAVGYKGVNTIDTSTPWDNTTFDDSSPESLSITTTSDGLAVGAIYSTDVALTTSDTEQWETAVIGGTNNTGCASAAGTGGSVSIDWSGATVFSSSGMNFRNATGGGGRIRPSTMTLFGVQ